MKKMNVLWQIWKMFDWIKYLIQTKTSNSDDYDNKYLTIKNSSDDDLPLEETEAIK